jgi:protocatechuate 3,4-dioxygenase alpha subunit
MAQSSNTQAPALKLAPTPGQTIGPFYGYALPFDKDNELVNQARPGAVRLHGVVTDCAGTPIPDALLEIWQADEDGNVVSKDGSLVRDGYTFTGFGRTAVDNVGHYTFTTLNPGATEAGKAPFIMLTVFARGLLNRLFTRIYLPEDTAALAADPLLASLDPESRKTLVATREADGSLRFDISLQGEGETVFLSYPRES